MKSTILDGRVIIPLTILFKEPNLGCYCPKCGVWYDCASSAHAGH